ncbi:MAG: hypothetical protein J1F28_05540 [Oscillospiraceae bacterium]|nr:hypothetical protein [Oscillospiraceae bacterium]
MKNGFKKILSGILAGALAVSLCGCADNGYIMTVDGMDIRNGIYIYYQQDAYATANDKLNEIFNSGDSENSADTTSLDFFAQTIENKSSSDWVKNETLRLVRQYVAIQRICAERNITLDDEDINEVNEVIREMWDEDNYIYQIYYGINNLGEYYESFGISRESMTMLYEVNSLKSKLFMSIYGKDGEQAVSEDDFIDHINKTYASAQIISIPYNDEYGKATTDATRIEDLKVRAQGYADMLNEGKSFADVLYECELAIQKEIAGAKATDEYNENPDDDLTLEEYVKKAVDSVTVDKISEEDADTLFRRDADKNSYSYDENLVDYILNADTYDVAVIYPSEDKKCVYVVVVTDITKNTHWQDKNRESVLTEIKGDDFEGFLDIYSQNYKVEMNSYLVDSKYSPEKLFKSE